MVNLSVKNVPEDVVERLRQRAKRHHRSLQGELLVILEESVEPKKLTVEETYRRIKALHFSTPDESTAWIRELRDAR
jgi:plasmid stability protein